MNKTKLNIALSIDTTGEKQFQKDLQNNLNLLPTFKKRRVILLVKITTSLKLISSSRAFITSKWRNTPSLFRSLHNNYIIMCETL